LHDRTGKAPKAQVYETRRVLKAKPHTAYFVTRPLATPNPARRFLAPCRCYR
jgi:hypothetical protein